MQVIHTVKNVGQNNHKVDLGFSVDLDLDFDGSNGDFCGHRNIEPFKGIFSFHLERNVTFLLHSTAFVTNVDTYSYSGMPNDGRWRNNTEYSEVEDGKGGWIYFSWQNRGIPPNEEKTFSYVVGVGDFFPYKLKLSPKIEEYYSPSSHLKLDFSLNSVESGQTVTIERDFEGNKYSKTLTDSGSPQQFPDEFDLPSSVGEHFVKYKVINEKFGEREFVYRILIDVPPEVSVLNWKKEFSSGENFSISLKVKCETKCRVSIINEKSENLLSFNSTGNEQLSRNIIIPESSPLSNHSITVFAINDFSIKYNETLNYSILPNPGKISLSKILPRKYITNKNITITGTVQAIDINTHICMFTIVKDEEQPKFGCFTFSDSTPQNFELTTNFTSKEPETVVPFNIRGKDNRNVYTNAIKHNFIITFPPSPRVNYCLEISFLKTTFHLFSASC